MLNNSNTTRLKTGNGLKGEYYDNKDFTNLKFTRTDPILNFNWGKGSPDSVIDANTFSTRWTGKIEPRFSETYNFYTTSDDGVRLWVDDQLIVDKFFDRSSSRDTATIDLIAGQKYDIRLEYYENTGNANANLAWSSNSQSYEIVPQSQLYSEPIVTDGTGDGLKGEYYNNKDFTNLKFTRTDPILNFNWGKGSPDSVIDANTFSTRWTGKIEPRFSETYNFYTTSDDGVRLWVDDQLIVDKFFDRASTQDTATIDLIAGQKYDIRMEYYENAGGANASLAWSSDSQKYEIVPQSQLYSKPIADSDNTTSTDTNNNTDSKIAPDIQPIQNSNQLKSVKIGGGGFVTGIVIHPLAADVMYARTDVGGLYRWDWTNQDWHQMLSMESVGQKVSLSVESIALDPNNPNVVYAAAGAHTHTGKGEEVPGNILKSIDGGNTWEVLDLSVPMGGNEKWRWAGERLAVDPHDSNVVYFGSRLDGLWRSQNGGKSWSQIDTSNIPVGKTWGKTKGVAGVTFIEFDESSEGVAYVGVAGKGVYQTTDNGNTWQSLEGISESLVPQQGEVNGDGELVVTLFGSQEGSSNGGIWSFDGYAWSDVTPKSGKNYAGLTVSDSDPNTLFSVSYPMTPDGIYRSTDGGDTWTALNNEQQSLGWYPDWTFWGLSGDLAVDSTNSNQVWLTTGIGVWKTEQGNSNDVTWSATVEGIEETVPFDAVSTPGGASLITAIADFDGFRHEDVTVVPTKNHSDGEFSTTTSIDYSSNNPNFIVRVGGNHNNSSQKQAGFSTDNGITWQNFASITNGTHSKDLNFGNIAVSAQNTNNIVWQGSNWAVPYYTKDGGQNWNRTDFFDQFGGGAHTHLWNPQQALAADSVNDGTFYIYHHVGGKLVRTQDGGESWTVANENNLLPSAWTDATIKAAPGKAGDIWVSLDDQGLYRSTNAGKTFTQISGVKDADTIGFGKAAPGTDNPTVFVSGEIDGQTGVFGSTDMGNTWNQFTDLPNEFLGGVASITGDMNTFGRVYLGVTSNGFIYGDL